MRALAHASHYLYVEDGEPGLVMIDVSDPANPVVVGSFDTPDYAWGVMADSDYAYVADDDDGLRIISVADPSNPAKVGSLDTPYYAVDVDVDAGYAYVADEASGIRIVQVTDPSNPVEVAFRNRYTAFGWDVARAGGYAYVPDDDAGLIILQYMNPNGIGGGSGGGIHLPRSFALSQNYPNPFNPVTTIRVDVPAGASLHTSLVIYDLRGRRVRTLVDGPLGGGSHLFTWDGRDDRGESVPSGAYIYRVSRGDRVLSRKMLLMK